MDVRLPNLRRRPGRVFLAEVALILVLAVLSVGVLGWQADDQDFSVDESRWIATSRYFWITVLDRDLHDGVSDSRVEGGRRAVRRDVRDAGHC